jgi:hypothetical protein
MKKSDQAAIMIAVVLVLCFVGFLVYKFSAH